MEVPKVDFDPEAEERARKKRSLKKAKVGFWLTPDQWVAIPRMPIEAADIPIPGPVTLPSGEVRHIVEEGTPYAPVIR